MFHVNIEAGRFITIPLSSYCLRNTLSFDFADIIALNDVYLSDIGAIYAGRLKRVNCTTNDTYPPPRVSWFLGSRNLTQNSSVQYLLDEAGRPYTLSELTFIPKRFEHGETLLCHAVQTYNLDFSNATVSVVNISTTLNISGKTLDLLHCINSILTAESYAESYVFTSFASIRQFCTVLVDIIETMVTGILRNSLDTVSKQ